MSTLIFALLSLPSAEAAPCGRTSNTCDSDRDGLTNRAEYNLGTNYLVADTDGDGLSDGNEVGRGTNPLRADTDGDTLSDGNEVSLGTNPLSVDTDGDTLRDNAEITAGTSPLAADTDGDGANDNVDAFPLDGAEWADADGDGTGDNADLDDDADGAPDALEVVGGPSLLSLISGSRSSDFLLCDWDLTGPLSLSNPNCFSYEVVLYDDYTAEVPSAGAWGEWSESVDGDGSWTFQLAFPGLNTASLRVNGPRVDPGSAVVCYQGYEEALGGQYTVGTGWTSYWWDPVGQFELCVN